MKDPIRIVELFSGLGSQARAFKNIGVDFCTVGICEWDTRALVAYDLIHNGKGLHKDVKGLNKNDLLKQLSKYELSGDCKNTMSHFTLRSLREEVLRQIYSSILRTNNYVNIKELKGEQLEDNIDVITYSFPCQDLSNVGSFHGYNKGIDRDANNRSGLLWQVERILKERRDNGLDLPKVMVLENVTTLLASRHNSNFEEWKNQLADLGYYNKVYSLKSDDFGSAQQNRRRLIMLSIMTDSNEKLNKWLDEYFVKHNLENPEYRKTIPIKKEEAKKHLKLDKENLIYFAEAKLSQPNNTPSRKTIWDRNLKIVDENGIIHSKVATITTKQDRHPNSGNIYFDYSGNNKSKYRFLTPRECFGLMGFTEKDYEVLIENNMKGKKGSNFFTRDNLLRLAGNSIVVQILEHVFKQIVDIINHIKGE